MNWGRAKTILIFMFLCTAVFQSYVLYTTKNNVENISPEIISSSIEILSNNKISINQEIIPTKNGNLPYVDAVNSISDYFETAKVLLGQDCKKKSETEFSSPLGSVTFSGNSISAKIISADSINVKNELYAQNLSRETLKELGINIKDAHEDITKNDDGYKIEYINTVDSVPVLNSKLTITVSKNGDTSINGKWFNISDKSDDLNLKSITAVLIDLIKEDIKTPAKITDIKLGYTVPESEQLQKAASLIPVWQFTFDGGQKLSVDARSPQ